MTNSRRICRILTGSFNFNSLRGWTGPTWTKKCVPLEVQSSNVLERLWLSGFRSISVTVPATLESIYNGPCQLPVGLTEVECSKLTSSSYRIRNPTQARYVFPHDFLKTRLSSLLYALFILTSKSSARCFSCLTDDLPKIILHSDENKAKWNI